MPKKYLFFLLLGPLSNLLWLFWALPEIHETGSLIEVVQWLGFQTCLVVLFFIGLMRGKKITFWVLLSYSILVFLYALGLIGWGLMGAATPLSVFIVAGLLFLMSLGLIYHTLQDLKIVSKPYKGYYLED